MNDFVAIINSRLKERKHKFSHHIQKNDIDAVYAEFDSLIEELDAQKE
jgi:hypothetical protein